MIIPYGDVIFAPTAPAGDGPSIWLGLGLLAAALALTAVILLKKKR